MKVLGITGGVGSGKSLVLDCLETEFGACICQMDETAKLLQKRGTKCFREIVRHFGEEIVGPDGELNREKLAGIVFSDEDQLEALNEIVHPAVLEHVKCEIDRKSAEGIRLYVVEAALLSDTFRILSDELWYIYVREDVRRERLKASRGYTDEKITRMIASQPSEEQFRAACDVVIDNSGEFEETKRQIGERLKL